MKNFTQYIVLCLVLSFFHVQAMDEMLIDQSHMPNQNAYSKKVTELLHSLDNENIDLSKCGLSPRQKDMLKSKKVEKEIYSLAGDFCYQNHKVQLAKQLYAKSSLLGNFNSLYELSKLFSDQETQQLLLEEAANHNCYQAKVYLGRIKEVY